MTLREEDTGDAMDRLVHHELRCSLAALVTVAINVVVVGVVRGFSSVSFDGAARLVGGVLAVVVLFKLLKATPIKWFGEVRDFDAAAPVAPETALPTEDFWHDHPVNWQFMPVLLVPTLAVALIWEPWFAVMPLWMAVDWALQAALIVYWERKRGRVLWRGRVRSMPWELAYSPVSPPPPTRTATDAPPV